MPVTLMWAVGPIIALGKQKIKSIKILNSRILSWKIKIGNTNLKYDKVEIKTNRNTSLTPNNTWDFENWKYNQTSNCDLKKSYIWGWIDEYALLFFLSL